MLDGEPQRTAPEAFHPLQADPASCAGEARGSLAAIRLPPRIVVEQRSDLAVWRLVYEQGAAVGEHRPERAHAILQRVAKVYVDEGEHHAPIPAGQCVPEQAGVERAAVDRAEARDV